MQKVSLPQPEKNDVASTIVSEPTAQIVKPDSRVIPSAGKGGFRPQSISISKNKETETLEQQVVKQDSKSNPVQQNNVFSDDEFFQAWSLFQNTLSDEARVGFLNLNLPLRVSDELFELVVNNVMQENEAKKLLTDILQFIRTRLANNAIVITTRIAEETEKQRSRSPEQLYVEMVNKNPQLEQFRKLLNLEID